MSLLTDLITRIKAGNTELGEELEREYKNLSDRLEFGLNFERHEPETVELHGRTIHKGDKVRIHDNQGTARNSGPRTWRVIGLNSKKKVADLESLDAKKVEKRSARIDDLVVLADFRDDVYPGLVSTGKVERGGDRSFHTVINGENFHVLDALTFTHRNKIDVVYIDPPYNTGAKDWKYNNNYVEKEDDYRHSKWLAFMERRLVLAKELLNPECSALIVTIDEKEHLRLGLLLEQIFPSCTIQMISTAINPKGVVRVKEFSRVNEFIFVCLIGQQEISPEKGEVSGKSEPIYWQQLRRSDRRSERYGQQYLKKQFYPIYVETATGHIKEIGDPILRGVDRKSVPSMRGCDTVFPVRPDNTEIVWGATADTLRSMLKDGYVRTRRHMPEKHQPWVVQYLTEGRIEDIRKGKATIKGYGDDGSVIAEYDDSSSRTKMPTTQWERRSHNAQHYGTLLVKSLLPSREFPYPKSLYAVEDTLRFFVEENPDAVVLDFFAGSGTTAHAVMRLNQQDNGNRQCILVTNNELGVDEQKRLRQAGLRPGDRDWEKKGIFHHITKPRIEAAITGNTPEGQPIKGEYKFEGESEKRIPMKNGFNENAEFFTLTYEISTVVGYNFAFEKIAPLLWIRAGGKGPRINTEPKKGWAVVERYGVITDLDKATDFCAEISSRATVRIAYIVTDDENVFQSTARMIPQTVKSVRLYETYLSNFRLSMGVKS